LGDLSPEEQRRQTEALVNTHFRHKFDLETGPLFSLHLIRLSKRRHLLLLNMHHMISDGWSMGVLVGEWKHIYTAVSRGNEPDLPVLPVQYTNYAAWQRQWLTGGDLRYRQTAYWKENLAGAPELLRLPTDFPRPAEASYRGGSLETVLDKETLHRLERFNGEHGVTLFMTLLTVFKVLLYRYSGQRDIVLGSPVAGRTHEQTEDIIGFFANTLALRSRIREDQTWRNLLREVRGTALAAYANQDIPFEIVIEAVNPSRNLSFSPLFQVMFVLQNAPMETLTLPGLEVSFDHREFGNAPRENVKFDLTLTAFETGNGLVCRWDYRADLFRERRIAGMAEHFRLLVEGMLENPVQAVRHTPMVTESEQRRLIQWGTGNKTHVPKTETVVHRFEQQVRRTPEQTAVVSGNRSLTYGALNRKAGRLAGLLREQYDIGPGRLVGICMERSPEMVIGIIAILKAGGAYVPLDPGVPSERLQGMIRDCNPPLILTRSDLTHRLPDTRSPNLCIDRFDPGQRDTVQIGSIPVQPEDPAYVLYTSGSTGAPKGVVVPHRALTNHMLWMIKTFGFTAQDITLQRTPYGFDASVWEFYAPLLTGGRMVMAPPDERRRIDTLLKFISEQGVTMAQMTPSLLQTVLTDKGDTKENTSSPLRCMFCGGEALSPETVALFSDHFPATALYNLYGPTEATIDTTWHRCVPGTDTVPLGTPVDNVRVFILDDNQHPQPIGVPGELCIAGAGLAGGYLNRTDLTDEKFITVDIFGESLRIYRTGDQACWVRNGDNTGTLTFLGRLDNQVKLRGFRIEPGEIEAVLTAHDRVKDAAVLYDSGDSDHSGRLVAYVTPARHQSARQLKTQLTLWMKDRLPEYMIPSGWVFPDTMPLTVNGKIDRAALPGLYPLKEDPVALPQKTALVTETEQLLCALWSQVLGSDISSTRADFFASGGHSLLATRLVSRIRESFSIEMPLRKIFEFPTVAEQARWVDGAGNRQALPDIPTRPEDAPRTLSFAQQRLWFLAQLEGQSATYNMPGAMALEGQLDIPALHRAFTALVERHENLRLCFPEIDGKPAVRIIPVYDPLKVTDLCDLPETDRQQEIDQLTEAHARAPFDLDTGPLLRFRLLRLSDRRQILLVNMHHIIGDGWSTGVLLRDWQRLYNAFAHKAPDAPSDIKLPELSVQYTDYAAWQRTWLTGDLLAGQLAYWQNELAGAPELSGIDTDFPRPPVQRFRGRQMLTTLDSKLTRGIKQLSRQCGVTVFMTLMGAFQVLLARYSGQTDLVLGTPIANRTHHQTENLIGFFVNTLAMRARIQWDHSFTEHLAQVRQTALGAYSHQDLPFEYLVEQLNPSRSAGHHPLFQVMFILQNAPRETFELKGIDLSFMKSEQTTAKFDLALSVEEQTAPDGSRIFSCVWEYDTDLFRPETITRMGCHYRILLAGILRNPDQTLCRLTLISEDEQQQLLAFVSPVQDQIRSARLQPKPRTIVELFEAQAEKTPDNTALFYQGGRLCYRDLNRKANQLARHLKNAGVTPESIVGVCLNPSPEMIIAILGILKAGGAYLPLDPDYPAARLRFMAEDSGMKVVVTLDDTENAPAFQGVRVTDGVNQICLDRDTALIEAYSGRNPESSPTPDSLAYVIYTSGSTGTPKGVMLEHGGLANLAVDQARQFDIREQSRILQFVSLSFDVATLDIAMTLTRGASLHLIPEQVTGEALTRQLRTHKITHVQLPVPVMATLPPAALP
ncbi:MAG: amino acid adenylation domain-containing protein, partial [Desulfobacterales bacterium]|nr:amino acid adenylation domain-containing protein [Desulfobacterales bacterium]